MFVAFCLLRQGFATLWDCDNNNQFACQQSGLSEHCLYIGVKCFISWKETFLSQSGFVHHYANKKRTEHIESTLIFQSCNFSVPSRDRFSRKVKLSTGSNMSRDAWMSYVHFNSVLFQQSVLLTIQRIYARLTLIANTR